MSYGLHFGVVLRFLFTLYTLFANIRYGQDGAERGLDIWIVAYREVDRNCDFCAFTVYPLAYW
jgi:hypothetical protein